MNHYFEAPKWEPKFCPKTSSFAKNKNSIQLQNVRVIEVTNATYRSSTFSGIFHLANTVKLPLQNSGMHRVEVYCLWFGHRLSSERGIKLLVNMDNVIVNDNYCGSVVSNIEK